LRPWIGLNFEGLCNSLMVSTAPFLIIQISQFLLKEKKRKPTIINLNKLSLQPMLPLGCYSLALPPSASPLPEL